MGGVQSFDKQHESGFIQRSRITETADFDFRNSDVSNLFFCFKFGMKISFEAFILEVMSVVFFDKLFQQSILYSYFF